MGHRLPELLDETFIDFGIQASAGWEPGELRGELGRLWEYEGVLRKTNARSKRLKI